VFLRLSSTQEALDPEYLKINKNWTFIDGGVTNLPQPMILEYNITSPSEYITIPLYGIVDVMIDWDLF